MFKVNNKDTRYFTLYSSVSVVNFEQVNADYGLCLNPYMNW